MFYKNICHKNYFIQCIEIKALRRSCCLNAALLSYQLCDPARLTGVCLSRCAFVYENARVYCNDCFLPCDRHGNVQSFFTFALLSSVIIDLSFQSCISFLFFLFFFILFCSTFSIFLYSFYAFIVCFYYVFLLATLSFFRVLLRTVFRLTFLSSLFIQHGNM